MEYKVGGRYLIKRKIGAGSFGEVFLGEDSQTHGQVAIKREPIKTQVPQLKYESKLYSILSNGICIPRMFWFGVDNNFNVMVMELLGKSLEDLFNLCNRRLSVKTVLMLADQMISAIEYVHAKGFIHRDVKPDNFMIGSGGRANQIFVIDFGLSKKYRDPTTHVHIPFTDNKSLTGTARYASVAALRGCEQSRRDDMESLGFVWLYLLRGSLPWMGLTAKDRHKKYERICEVKAKTSFEELCRGFPDEFVTYFHTVRNLKFTQEPDYSELRNLFRDAFMRLGYTYDYLYDWTITKPASKVREDLIPKTAQTARAPPAPIKPEEVPEAGVRQIGARNITAESHVLKSAQRKPAVQTSTRREVSVATRPKKEPNEEVETSRYSTVKTVRRVAESSLNKPAKKHTEAQKTSAERLYPRMRKVAPAVAKRPPPPVEEGLNIHSLYLDSVYRTARLKLKSY